MIGYLKGKVVLAKANFAIIEVSGVGYKVYCKNPFELNSLAELFTYEHTRENVSDLYGFESVREMDIFERLLDVSGIGPKGALTICANLKPDQLQSAVENSDIQVFRSVPGIGPKVASKIIIELKNKISGNELSDLDSVKSQDAVEAMQALGYKPQEIIPLLKSMPEDVVETKNILSYLMKNAGKK